MPTKVTHRSGPSWAFPLTVLIIAAVLIALIVTLNKNSDSPTSQGTETSEATETPGATEPGQTPPATEAPTEVQGPEQPDFTVAERRDDSDLLATGPVDAPVALIVFSDYQCPFCARWNADTLPLMKEQTEAGNLRIEWRDVNVFGAASERASRASYAAGLQGAFWDYHDVLFAHGETRSERDLSEEALISLAGDLGLDTNQFATDLNSDQTATEIARNAQLGLDLGAYSTPIFILGGQPIMGAQPSQVFTDAFATALSAVK